MKKLLSVILSIILLIVIHPSAFAYSGTCSAKAAILFQPDTNTVLFEKDAKSAHLIASTTKIMTALVVLENAFPDEMVEILPDYTGVEGSTMSLKAGERFTVKELLYGMMLLSGNDAATALACSVSGSVEEFALLMNAKAYEIGCVNSHFVNPHGLDAEMHYSCAFDLALIMAEAMKNDTFAEITACQEMQIAGRNMRNHNKLLWTCGGCIGGKTGYTEAAGRTLVSVCDRDGVKLICVTISAPDDWNDHKKLFDWGFSEFSFAEITDVFVVPVISGESDSVVIKCEDRAYFYRSNEELLIQYIIPQFLYAPVYYGESVGSVRITSASEVTEYKLTAAETVLLDEAVPLSLWEQLKWSWYYYNGHSGYIPFLPRY